MKKTALWAVCALCLWGCAPAPTDNSNFLTDNGSVEYVSRVLSGDTYQFRYRNETITVRLRMPNPKDSIDCFDSADAERAQSQAARARLTLAQAQRLGGMAQRLADSLLVGKPIVLIRYPDQNDFAQQFSEGRLLRGVLVGAKLQHIGELLRARKLTLENYH